MSSDHTPIPAPPWRWLDNHTLVADHGCRPVVLTSDNGEDLRTRNPETGLLVQLTSDHPVARAIGALPDLLAACEAAIVYLEAFCAEHPEHLLDAIALDRIRASVARARGEG